MYGIEPCNILQVLTTTQDIDVLTMNIQGEMATLKKFDISHFLGLTVLNKWNDGTYFVVCTFAHDYIKYDDLVPTFTQFHLNELIGEFYNATIAPFKVQQIGDWHYRAELEDVEGFIKRWSNFETSYVDARYVFDFLKLAGIPFVPRLAVNKCYAPDQDPEYHYVVEWRQKVPYLPVAYKERYT